MYQLEPDTEITAKVIKAAIDYNEDRRDRFDKLDNYYIGKQDILNRTKADTTPNNKVMVNHAKYIVDTNIGYLLGNPVDYTAPDGVDIEPVLAAYKKQTMNNLDTEIAKECGIFGVKYEYVYANELAEPVSVSLDVRNTLIVYDNTMRHNKLFAVNYRPIYKKPGDKEPERYEVLVATQSAIQNYTLENDKLVLGEEYPHAFGAVPVIEYVNNGEYLGDFEPVISLIDAYNLIQSDRVNDREQLVDAILCFYGMQFDGEQMDSLREHRAISNIPSDGKVEYLIKSINETDADVLRKNIEADIHKISMVPNMSDENFVGNSSGVAIRYKLLAFEQNIRNKERYFEKGLMERFSLYSKFLQTKSAMAEIPLEDVDALFRRNLPNNDYETSQMTNNLAGLVDKELLAAQLSFVTDASETVAKAQAEQEVDSKPIDSEFGQNEMSETSENVQNGVPEPSENVQNSTNQLVPSNNTTSN